jgi:hypothetical protein
MGQLVNLIGKTFGRLTVIEKTDKRGSSGAVFWRCLCECGKTKDVSSSCLKGNQTKSCGCLFLEVSAAKGKAKHKHGMTGTSTYRSWGGMKQRCYNTNDKKYMIYGGRGIFVCQSWKNSFESFYNDMGEAPDGMSIDRIDVNGNYEPSNCQWATQKQQQNNRSNNLILEYQSKKYTLQRLCDHLGKNSDKVQQRLKRGDSLKRALR